MPFDQGNLTLLRAPNVTLTYDGTAGFGLHNTNRVLWVVSGRVQLRHLSVLTTTGVTGTGSIRLRNGSANISAAIVAAEMGTGEWADSSGFGVVGAATPAIGFVYGGMTSTANNISLNYHATNELTAGTTVFHCVYLPLTADASMTHTPGISQVETATVVEAVDDVLVAGDASVTVTAAGMTNSPKTISVAVATNDSESTVAGKIRTALAADVDVSAMFTVSGATDKVILTAITPAANDTTLNIAIADGTCVGLTAAPTSANTTPGQPPGS